MQAITTKDGKLVITITQESIHDLNWKSGTCAATTLEPCTDGRRHVDIVEQALFQHRLYRSLDKYARSTGGSGIVAR